MIDYKYFLIQNPWWQQSQAIEHDDKIVEHARARYPYTPKDILGLPLGKGDVHVITGPRQTGKSTALKLLIKKHIDRGTLPPRSLVYFGCDAVDGAQGLIDLVLAYQEYTAAQKPTLMILDEVSSVDRWPHAIKWLVDAGRMKQTTMVLTGSSSIQLKKSGELLPGRRGKGKDIRFLPISFSQYVELTTKSAATVSLGSPHAVAELSELSGPAKRAYGTFLETGGFLRNINNGLTVQTNALYLASLKSELYKAGKKEESMREVIRKIITSLSSQTSYTNIAEEAELGSKNTAIDYLSFLVDSFFLQETKFWNREERRVVLKKNKKFYTIDPYILWVFQGLVSGIADFGSFPTLIDSSHTAENFVATELIKQQRHFYFFHNTRELDFYLPEETTGIEVKYKDKITSDDLKGLHASKQKLLISKNTLEHRGDTWIVPVHLFPFIRL